MKKFLLLTLAFFAPLVLLALCALPFVLKADTLGDLSRMSATRFSYAPPLPDTSLARAHCVDLKVGDPLPDSISRNHIAVYGDSFSLPLGIWPHGSRWHQYMGGAMKRPIVCVTDVGGNPFQEVLALLEQSPEALPDTIVVQTAERVCVNRLVHLEFNRTPQADSSHKNTLPKVRLTQHILNYYKAKLRIDKSVLRLPLDADLFSCRPRTLFALRDDVENGRRPNMPLLRGNLSRLLDVADSAGKVLYVLVIPDKYSVYRHHLATPPDGEDYRLLEDTSFVSMSDRHINPLPQLQRLVDQGVKDVYLPDESHFSPLAAKEVGLLMARRMRSEQEAR